MSIASIIHIVKSELRKVGYNQVYEGRFINDPISKHFEIVFDITLNTQPYFLKVNINYQHGVLQNNTYIIYLALSHSPWQTAQIKNSADQEFSTIDSALTRIQNHLLSIFSIM